MNDEVQFRLMINAIMNNTLVIEDNNEKIDFSGSRVNAYANLINVCDEIQFGVRLFLTGYY